MYIEFFIKEVLFEIKSSHSSLGEGLLWRKICYLRCGFFALCGERDRAGCGNVPLSYRRDHPVKKRGRWGRWNSRFFQNCWFLNRVQYSKCVLIYSKNALFYRTFTPISLSGISEKRALSWIGAKLFRTARNFKNHFSFGKTILKTVTLHFSLWTSWSP